MTHCKLKKNIQKNVAGIFVLEVIARCAADLLEIHPNTAALFYKKIRLVISPSVYNALDVSRASIITASTIISKRMRVPV